jgi:mRNA interferase RelE/StbE
LPDALRAIFEDICQSVLSVDPQQCLGLPHHALKGDLAKYKAIELNWGGEAYRLVYRIYDSPTPRRVVVLSFAEHDPAYKKAKERK